MQPISERQTEHVPTGYSRQAFNEINQAGAYVTDEGTLLRVPEDAIAAGRSPLITVHTQSDMLVTRVSANPWVTVSKARQLASQLDIQPNF